MYTKKAFQNQRSEDHDNSDQIEISDARNELQANSEEAFHKDLVITWTSVDFQRHIPLQIQFYNGEHDHG